MSLNYSKKIFLGAALIVLTGAAIFTAIQLSAASPPNPGHKASEVGGTDLAADRTFQNAKYIFPNDLEVTGNCIGCGGGVTGCNDCDGDNHVGEQWCFNNDCSSHGDDCDDNNNEIYPDSTHCGIENDGIDMDCNGNDNDCHRWWSDVSGTGALGQSCADWLNLQPGDVTDETNCGSPCCIPGGGLLPCGCEDNRCRYFNPSTSGCSDYSNTWSDPAWKPVTSCWGTDRTFVSRISQVCWR